MPVFHRCRTQGCPYLSMVPRHTSLIISLANICSSRMFRAASLLLTFFLSNHCSKVYSSMVRPSNLKYHRDPLQPAAKVCPV